MRSVLLILVMVASFGVDATMCKCRQHNSEAESGGTCSRTEDASYCTLKFTTTTPAEYEEFIKRLSQWGIPPPRDSLQFAFTRPPEHWERSDLEKHLPALFAVSQRTRFSGETKEIAKVIREGSSIEREQLFRAFTEKYSGKAYEFRLSNFSAVVSRGCVELRRDRFYAMVKTKYSEAEFFCDDFKK